MKKTSNRASLVKITIAVILLSLVILSYVFNRRLIAFEDALFNANYLSMNGRFVLTLMVAFWFARAFAPKEKELGPGEKAFQIAVLFSLLALMAVLFVIFTYIL